jgi:hypothetical protein
VSNETQDSDAILKQKSDVVDKLWQAQNIVTGYGVIQGVALVLAFANVQQRQYLLNARWVLGPGVVVIGAVLAALVYFIGRYEMRLRKELGADESLMGTARGMVRGRIGIIGLIHVAVALVVIVVHARAL